MNTPLLSSLWKIIIDTVFPDSESVGGQYLPLPLLDTHAKKTINSYNTTLETYYIWEYSHPKIKKLLEHIKLGGYFNRIDGFVPSFTKAIQDIISKQSEDSCVVIPVSLDKKRLNHRGFSLLIELLDKSHIQYTKAFKDIVSKEFAQLNAKDRKKAILPITWHEQVSLPKNTQYILLVDDVITTGSTLAQHASYILHKFPNVKIICIALAQA